MMYHHSKVPYAVAAAKCSRVIRERFEAQIEKGKKQAQSTLLLLQQNQPVDNFIWQEDMTFDADVGSNQLLIRDQSKSDASEAFDLHRNALGQAASWAGIPMQYVNRMLDDGQYNLATSNFNTRFRSLPWLKKPHRPRRFNARSVGNQVRGLVSDAFARWNTNRLVEAFVEAVVGRSGVVVHAVYTDLQFSIKAVLPTLFEPAEGEVMLFGIGIQRSDFGLARLCLDGVVNRPWCTNLATTESAYTRNNISTRYDDNDTVSQKTLDRQTEAHASAIGDLVNRYLSADFASMQAGAVHRAANTKLGPIDAALKVLKGTVTKEESEQLKAYYESEEDELLPQGKTVWRLSNALSLLAQKSQADRRMELEKVAGSVAGLKNEAEMISQ